MSHPLDPADLRRCLLLLKASPETRMRLSDMAVVSPEWRGLLAHWDELERTFIEEAGSLEAPDWSAQRTYDAMQAILERASSTSSLAQEAPCSSKT